MNRKPFHQDLLQVCIRTTVRFSAFLLFVLSLSARIIDAQQAPQSSGRHVVNAYGLRRVLNTTTWAGAEYPDGGRVSQ